MDIFTLVGNMTLKGQEKVQQQLSKTEERAKKVSAGLMIMGAAFTAVGAAGLILIQKTKAMNAQLGVTALNLNVSIKEMRNLTLAATNVTFPLDEVIATFDLLARAGVKDTEVLKTTAIAFDTLSDATGKSASQVTQMMIPAMKTFGLSAEEMAKKTDIMTYMSRESTMSMEDFNTMVGYTTPELVKQGLTIEDLTAGLIYMERQGYAPGRVMTREFMKATTLAQKEQISLTEALGMTTAETKALKDELEGATGMTQRYADVANEQYTIMDKVKQRFSEITLSMSGFLEPLEPVLAGMTALGPLMILLSTSAGTAAIKWGLHTVAMVAHKVALFASAVAIKAVTIAQWLWNAAMTANPIGLIIVGIGALIGAGIALWKNWDKVTEFFKKAWNNIKVVFLSGVKSLLSSLVKFTSWIPVLGDKVQEAHDAISGMIDSEKVKKAAAAVIKAEEEMAEAIKKRAGELTEVIKEELKVRRDEELKHIQDSRDVAQRSHDDQIEELRRTYGVLEREDEKYQDTKLDAARKATDEAIKLIDEEYSARLRLLDDETAAIISKYQARIDAIDAQTEAEEQVLKEAEREKRLTELKGAVESASTEEERLEAIDQLEEYQARVARERLLEGRQAERENLRDLMDEARNAAAQERARLKNELEEKKVALDEALEDELARIDDERIAFEKAETDKLTATIERLEEEEETLTAHYEEQLTEAELHVAAINRATEELKDRTVVITTVHRTVTEGRSGAGLQPDLSDYQYGGLIPEPTLLYGLRSKRPYAIAGDKGIEQVGPIGGGGRQQMMTIIWEMDGRQMAKAIMPFAVGEIRLRTGAKR